jgi:hypothetical protein
MASTKTIVTMICITLISLVAVGCSDDSSPVAQASVDTAPPAVPANLNVAYDADSGAAGEANRINELRYDLVEQDRRGRSQFCCQVCGLSSSFTGRSGCVPAP